jgi:hypothetical protein
MENPCYSYLISFFSDLAVAITQGAHQKLKNSMTGVTTHTIPINPPK